MNRDRVIGVWLMFLALLLFAAQTYNRFAFDQNAEDNRMISKQTERNLRGADLLFLAMSTTVEEHRTEENILQYALQIGARDKPKWTAAELQRIYRSIEDANP